MTRTQTVRERVELAEWREAIISNVGTETTGRHGDRGPDDLGSMRAVIWCAVIAGLLMVSSCVIKTRLTMAHAQMPEVHLIAHGLSWHNHSHTSAGDPYNQSNPGMGLRADLAALVPTFSVQVGGYRNSYQRHSTYALADWTPWAWGPIKAGAFAGAATGYPAFEGRLMPAAGVIVRATWGRLSAALRASPGKESRGVAALELGVRL